MRKFLRFKLPLNPDFKIWQRYNSNDATTFTNPVNKYIADRYRFNGTGTVKPVAGGAEITGTINIKYILEDADFQKLNGKTLTRSWSENGLIQKETFVCNSVTIFDKTITNKTVNFIKIELGEIATPFSPRSYAEELAMCQRYFQLIPRIRIKTDRAPLEQKAPYSLPVVMRTTPTISYTGGDSIAFIETDYCENHILLSIMTTNTIIDITFTNVKLDAEIY